MATQPGDGGSAIQHVASERVSDERQMGPDLVEDTGGDLDLDQRETSPALGRRKARDRRPRTVRLGPLGVARRPDLSVVVRVVRERHVDLASRVQLAGDQREVAFLHAPSGELSAKHRMSRLCSRREQEAGSVGVEPVHEAALASGGADAGQLRETADQRIRRGPRFAGLERVRRHSRRFVGDDDLRSRVDGADRQLGLRHRRIGRGPADRDARARSDLGTLRTATAIDAYAVFRDPLHRAPATHLEQAGQRAIEPVGRRAAGDRPLVHLVAHALARAERTCCAAHELTA